MWSPAISADVGKKERERMDNERKKRPVKLLLVALDFGPGGAQRQLVNIANGFHEKGHDVSVFAFPNRRDPEVVRCSLEEDVDVVATSATARKLGIFGTMLATVELFRTVLARRPDVVYSRQWPKMPIALIGRLAGAKTVSVEGDSIGHTLGKRPLLLRARKLCARLSDRVVANSEGLAHEVKEAFEISAGVAMIHNGIDLGDVRKRSEEPAIHEWFGGDVPVILAVGAHKKQKGFAHLLQAVSFVNRRMPARVMIMGGGDKEGLLRLARELSIEDVADFPNAVPNPFPYFRAADVFACASLHEGFSNAILEAMALGKPVVSTNHRHGADEMIEDGKNGLLVPTGDPESMAGEILRLLEDGELRARLGAAAAARAERFSRERMIEEYESLFAELLEEKR